MLVAVAVVARASATALYSIFLSFKNVLFIVEFLENIKIKKERQTAKNLDLFLAEYTLVAHLFNAFYLWIVAITKRLSFYFYINII